MGPTRRLVHAIAAVSACVLGQIAFLPPPGASAASVSGSRAAVPVVWHVETTDGRVESTMGADEPINPASVIKVATTRWALETLGPYRRFDTRFATNGTIDPSTGRLDGDLVVVGGGDPDFHVENAYLVAGALNRLGLERVGGDLRVGEGFWIGWEGGSARRVEDARKRAGIMAARLRDAFDPGRWDDATTKAIAELALRRGLPAGTDPPRIVIEGSSGPYAGAAPESVLIVHRSNGLEKMLKRFNAYSNNDIERLAWQLGPAEELRRRLISRWSAEPGAVRLATLSGLGVNRLTPRQVVRLLHDLHETVDAAGMRFADVLPSIGCDPGTLENFDLLAVAVPDGALIAKTGTLVTTDGGVAVLAGIVHTAKGSLVFCVATPGTGRHPARARDAQQRWLLDLIQRSGGARPTACGMAVGYSDDDAEVRSGAKLTPAP